MKTKFTLVVAMVVAFFAANAQNINNGGFENWTGSRPTNWYTIDQILTQFGETGTKFVTKDSASNKVEGTYSAKLYTDTSVVASRLLPGILSIGSVAYANGIGIYTNGVPFTSRPDSLKFSFKSVPAAGDTAVFNYNMTKWNATGDSADLIGGIPNPYVLFLNPSAAFLSVTIPVDYYSASTPDTLSLVFYSGIFTKKTSTLWVDDVKFVYNGTTDVEDLSLNTTVSLYPVPASATLNISVKENMIGQRYEIANLNGQVVATGVINSNINTVDVSEFATGTYLFKAIANNGKVSTGRFNVAH